MANTTTKKQSSKNVELESNAKGAGSAERAIEDRAGEQRDSDTGDTIEDDGVVIGTPTPDEDMAAVEKVMDAIASLFTANVERTSQRDGEVYVTNVREFPMKGMLKQFIRQLDFDMTNLRGSIAKKEAELSRLHRRVNADPVDLKAKEARIENLYDAYTERNSMREHAVAYYPELTGEYYETPKGPKTDAPKATVELTDFERRQAQRKSLLGID